MGEKTRARNICLMHCWTHRRGQTPSPTPSALSSKSVKPLKIKVNRAKTLNTIVCKEHLAIELPDSNDGQTPSPTPSALSSCVKPSKVEEKCAKTLEKTDSKEHLSDEPLDSSGGQTPSPAPSDKVTRSVKLTKARMNKTGKELPRERLGSGDWLKPTPTPSYLFCTYIKSSKQDNKISTKEERSASRDELGSKSLKPFPGSPSSKTICRSGHRVTPAPSSPKTIRTERQK